MGSTSGTGAGGAAAPSGGDEPARHDAGHRPAGDPQAAPRPPKLRFSSWSVARGLLLLTFGFLVVRVVTLASAPLWWLSTAAVVAALFQPAIIFLRRWMPSWVAVLLLLAVVGAGLGLGGYRGLEEINRQVTTVRENALVAAGDLEGSTTYGSLAQEFGLRGKVATFFDSLPPVLGGSDTSAAVQAAASGASALFAIFMLTLLLLVFGRRFARAALAQIDDPVVRHRVTGAVYLAYQRSSLYVWSMIGRSITIGIVVFVGASLGGFPAPTALAFWFAGWSLVPAVGLVVAVAPLGLGLAVVSPPVAIVIGVGVIVLQVLDAVFVQRLIERRSVHVGPALTLVAALVGGSLYGVGGVLILLALTVFGMAFLRETSGGLTDVPGSLRALVTPPPALVGAGAAIDPPGTTGSVGAP